MLRRFLTVALDIAVIAAFAVIAPRAHAQSAYGVTAFGTELVTAAQIRETYAQELNELIALQQSRPDEFQARRAALESTLNGRQQFRHVNIAVFRSYTDQVDVVIDFVEHADAPARLAYRRLEPEDIADPQQLIAEWRAYATLSQQLFDAREITDMQCPVVHCTWAFNHERLRPFLDRFTDRVPRNVDALTRILVHHRTPEAREAAAYLLAHAGITPQQLVATLEPSIDDPSHLVRNAGMRVVYYAVRADSALPIPLDKIITALHYPSFTDRNKALVILRSLPSSRFSRAQLRRFLPVVLEILKKGDAHNFRNAHAVLRNLSGQTFGVEETERWEAWVRSVAPPR